MGLIKEGPANFTTDELQFINYVTGDDFPWYIGKPSPNFLNMGHHVIIRSEPNSGFYDVTKGIFDRICEENNIVVSKIHHMMFNLSFTEPNLHDDPQLMKYKALLIYLNKFDGGETYLFDENHNITNIIEPKMDKFVLFENAWHAEGFCKPRQNKTIFLVIFEGEFSN